jgi:hypothetical protein
MGIRRTFAFALALLATCCCLSRPAAAATDASIFERVGTFTFVGVDPSCRSAGMGGASSAVFWGDDLDAWANPALPGLVEGVHYEDGLTSIFPGEIDLVTRQTTLGYGGLGLSLVGQPFDGLGKREIAMGPIYQTTAYSTVTSLSVYDRTRSWGVGASLSRLLGTAARLRHREAPAFTRHADLAVGYAENVLESGWIPSDAPPSIVRGVSHDLGLLARAGTAMTRGGGDAMPLRLGAAYALVAQGNGHDHMGGVPLERRLRHAGSARASLGPPARWTRDVPAWIAPAFDSFLSLGLAYDFERLTYGYAGTHHSNLHHYGAELGITDVLAVQLGTTGFAGGYSETSWGWSAALPVGRFGGARYAYARVPKSPGFDPSYTPHRSWSVWLDPLALAHAGR